MICVEIHPRYGSKKIVVNPKKNEKMDLKEFFTKYLENHPDNIDDSIREIEYIEKENRYKYKKNAYRKIVLSIENPPNEITSHEYAKTTAKGLGTSIMDISYMIEEIFFIRPIGQDDSKKRAEIIRLEFPDKYTEEEELELEEFEGIAGARGYDIKEEVENKYGIDLFWNWDKWNKVEVSNKI